MTIDLDKFWLDREQAVLVVIDVQAKLTPAMPPTVYARMRATTAMLVEAARLFGIPVVTTEQYPQGIGHTVPELATACQNGVVEKTSFGCCGEPAFLTALAKLGRRQMIVTGMEAHVCVYQTVLGLLGAGYDCPPGARCHLFAPQGGFSRRRQQCRPRRRPGGHHRDGPVPAPQGFPPRTVPRHLQAGQGARPELSPGGATHGQNRAELDSVPILTAC